MEIYYTTEDKYIHAVRKLDYGYVAKAKLLFEEILEEEPDNGKAHYQMGRIYLDEIIDVARAEMHLALAQRFEPSFIPLYYERVRLLFYTRMHDKLIDVTDAALQTPGVAHAWIYSYRAFSFEQQEKFQEAILNLKKALMASVNENETEKLNAHLLRVTRKKESLLPFVYNGGTANNNND